MFLCVGESRLHCHPKTAAAHPAHKNPLFNFFFTVSSFLFFCRSCVVTALLARLAGDKAVGTADTGDLFLLPREIYHAYGRGGAGVSRVRPGGV